MAAAVAADIDPVRSAHGSGDGDSLRKDTLSTGDKVVDDESRDDGTDDTPYVVDKAAERALTRKFDLRLLPVLAIMVREPRYVHVRGARGLHKTKKQKI